MTLKIVGLEGQVDGVTVVAQFNPVVYGLPRVAGVIPAFDGVIEALSIRYVMFAESGVPLRATVSLRLKEADKIKIASVQL